MKKTKLLTTLAAFVLVLGLGACDQVTEENTPTEGSDTTETTETPDTEESEDGDVTITNYTLSFTFTLSEEKQTLPSYESLYIAGDFNDWAFSELTLNEEAYEVTIPSITVGEHQYKVLLAYSGAPDWDNEIIPANEDNTNATFTVSEGDTGYSLTYELTKSFSDYLEEISTRTNFTVYFHFTDASHEATYSIPSYADGYVTGYITSENTWTDYTIGGDWKLVAAEDGTYSVTFATIHTGVVTYNIYFEFNNSAQNHDAASSASWNASRSIGGSSNTTMTIPATGEAHIDIQVNPADLISDEASTASCTIAVNDTAHTGKTLYLSGTMNSWNNSNAMTYDASGTDYQYSYTFTPDPNTEYEFGIFNNSTWGDSILFGTAPDGCRNSNNDLVLGSSVIGEYTTTLVILTVDGSTFGGSSHTYTTSVSITH